MEEYKILKLTKEEISTLKKALVNTIVDVKIKQDKYDPELYKEIIKKNQEILSYLIYIER